MPIVIKTEKVVNGNGKKCRKILEVLALERPNLPGLYLSGYPQCFKNGQTFCIRKTETGPGWVWCRDEIISEEEFQSVMVVVAESGARLREVNKTLSDLRADWHGEETFII